MVICLPILSGSFFFFLASAYTDSAVTDGLRDFEINGVAILSLFPYILPIALSDSGYCLSTGTQRGSRSLKSTESDTLLYSF